MSDVARSFRSLLYCCCTSAQNLLADPLFHGYLPEEHRISGAANVPPEGSKKFRRSHLSWLLPSMD